MCTATTYQSKDFYFGRTLDYEFSYGETVTVTPRNYTLSFRNGTELKEHHAIIGMAHISEGYPLYYDAINEKGLGMAGLNFVDNACYFDLRDGKDNITQFEFIPWILAQCATVNEARDVLSRVNLWNQPFSEQIPLAQLHWIIADKTGAITVESMKDGLHVYDNPVGVLANNPPFPMQMFNLNNYMGLSPDSPDNRFSSKLELTAYSRGMGAMGLPGDLSSMSRFVRAAFTRINSISEADELSSVSQFFHILGAVDQQRGCCRLGEDKCEITIYTSCCNTERGIYYYTTYDGHTVRGVDMHRENLNSSQLISYPLIIDSELEIQN